ncbi:hypothetical protein BIW11_02467 [Tropilaelaps mercedesae]|uniref:Uncharacterized protein n=1 Tax=Tropilaelaps mercedesae TaxID=418985 RepID=A0A1V9Y2K0_9ACAR|nr:hypothetical protein BIW11_02467 [Tropilaelaps mercedesae]
MASSLNEQNTVLSLNESSGRDTPLVLVSRQDFSTQMHSSRNSSNVKAHESEGLVRRISLALRAGARWRCLVSGYQSLLRSSRRPVHSMVGPFSKPVERSLTCHHIPCSRNCDHITIGHSRRVKKKCEICSRGCTYISFCLPTSTSGNIDSSIMGA